MTEFEKKVIEQLEKMNEKLDSIDNCLLHGNTGPTIETNTVLDNILDAVDQLENSVSNLDFKVD